MKRGIIFLSLLVLSFYSCATQQQGEQNLTDSPQLDNESHLFPLVFDESGKFISVDTIPVEHFSEQAPSLAALCLLMKEYPYQYRSPSYFEFPSKLGDEVQIFRILDNEKKVLAEIRQYNPRPSK